MELKDKDFYVAPTVLVVAVQSEGIVCASGEGRSLWENDD